MTDIAELFSTDPLSLTKDNITEIITAYRKARAQFDLGAKGAGSTKKVKEKGPKITDINLAELGLDELLK